MIIRFMPKHFLNLFLRIIQLTFQNCVYINFIRLRFFEKPIQKLNHIFIRNDEGKLVSIKCCHVHAESDFFISLLHNILDSFKWTSISFYIKHVMRIHFKEHLIKPMSKLERFSTIIFIWSQHNLITTWSHLISLFWYF